MTRRAAILAIVTAPKVQTTEQMNGCRTCTFPGCGKVFDSFPALVAHEREADHAPERTREGM